MILRILTQGDFRIEYLCVFHSAAADMSNGEPRARGRETITDDGGTTDEAAAEIKDPSLARSLVRSEEFVNDSLLRDDSDWRCLRSR